MVSSSCQVGLKGMIFIFIFFLGGGDFSYVWIFFSKTFVKGYDFKKSSVHRAVV